MHILVIGTWYVWLTHGTCLAHLWHTVTCIDIDETKIARLQQWHIPIYEPWLEELVIACTRAGRLQFSTSLIDHLTDVDIVFIAVGTPPGVDGHADLQYVQAVAKQIGQHMTKYLVVVNKSTVPVGTWDMVAWIINQTLTERWLHLSFDVVSNPEFLKEWTAVEDFFEWDRIVLWCDNPDGHALGMMEHLYAWLTNTVILKTDLHTAELIKYSANALLAVEISFINSIAQLCEKVWADVTMVSTWLKLDSRIWKKAFVNAWPWFGGSCFPKDVMELAQTFRDHGTPNGILDATLAINDLQKHSIFGKVQRLLPDLTGKTVSILGLAFKANTDDIRYSSSLVLIDNLLSAGAILRVYDPKAMDNFRYYYPNLTYASSATECVEQSDCIVLMTAWPEFWSFDWSFVASHVRQKNLVDAINMYTLSNVLPYGFTYVGVGR